MSPGLPPERFQQRYGHLQNITFQQSRAEDVVDSGADMATVAECLPLMDLDQAMATFGSLLRPGGTLAIWFYGGPIYADPGHEDIQSLHRAITARSFDELRPLTGHTWDTIRSWLDNVKLPANHWKDVKRIKWNSDRPLSFSDEFESALESAIQPEETVKIVTDREFWAKDVDFLWARGFIAAQIPRQESYITPEVERMYARMEKLMSGKLHRITWPVVLILATKK